MNGMSPLMTSTRKELEGLVFDIEINERMSLAGQVGNARINIYERCNRCTDELWDNGSGCKQCDVKLGIFYKPKQEGGE